MPQKEPESESESEPEATPYELIHHIREATGPDAVWLRGYEHGQRMIPLSNSQSAKTDLSSPPRSAKMLAPAITNRNGSTSAKGKLFKHLAKRAIQKVVRQHYPEVELGQIDMQMVMNALSAGWGRTGAILRRLEHILRKAIPRALATIKDVLTAEKTPEGSDHAPIPGAYPIMPEVPAAAEAKPVDRVKLESALGPTRPGTARLGFRPTRPEVRPTYDEMRTSKESSGPSSSRRCSPYWGVFRSEAERRAFEDYSANGYTPKTLRLLASCISSSRSPVHPASLTGHRAPLLGLSKSPYNINNPPGSGYIPLTLRLNQTPEEREIYDYKQRVRAFRSWTDAIKASLANASGLSLTQNAEVERPSSTVLDHTGLNASHHSWVLTERSYLSPC